MNVNKDCLVQYGGGKKNKPQIETSHACQLKNKFKSHLLNFWSV